MKTTIYDKINAAKEERAREIENLKAQLKAEKEKEKKATAEMENALSGGNSDDYAKAKALKREAEDKAEYFTIQIKNKSDGALFEEGDRKQLTAQVRNQVEKIKGDKLKEAAALLVMADKIVNEVREEYIKANGALDVIEKNSGTNARHYEMIYINGLCITINNAKDHADIKPYI